MSKLERARACAERAAGGGEFTLPGLTAEGIASRTTLRRVVREMIEAGSLEVARVDGRTQVYCKTTSPVAVTAPPVGDHLPQEGGHSCTNRHLPSAIATGGPVLVVATLVAAPLVALATFIAVWAATLRGLATIEPSRRLRRVRG